MIGNVWEWCADWYGSDYYNNSPSFNPQGPSSGGERVFRGGSWLSAPHYTRLTNRHSNKPNYRSAYLGFRVALSSQK